MSRILFAVLFITLLSVSVSSPNSMGEAFGLLNELKQAGVIGTDRYRLEALSYQAIYGDWNNPKLMLPIDSVEGKLLSQWQTLKGLSQAEAFQQFADLARKLKFSREAH